jgi:hypothetical protein
MLPHLFFTVWCVGVLPHLFFTVWWVGVLPHLFFTVWWVGVLPHLFFALSMCFFQATLTVCAKLQYQLHIPNMSSYVCFSDWLFWLDRVMYNFF